MKKSKKPAAMHPALIKSALEMNGMTQRAIAIDLDLSVSAVNNVISGKSNSRRVAEAIAKATGYSIEKIWPGRYPTIDVNDAA